MTIDIDKLSSVPEVLRAENTSVTKRAAFIRVVASPAYFLRNPRSTAAVLE